MPSRRYKLSQSVSHFEILARVKREMQREQQVQKAQENLSYLNNSFEIFIDLSKGKKSKFKSNQIKAMYTLFSDNKANTLIFQKIAAEELKRIKAETGTRESSLNKWTQKTKGMMEIIEEQQAENQGQISNYFFRTANRNNPVQENTNLQTQNDHDNSRNSLKSHATRSSYMKTDRSSIFERTSVIYDTSQEDDKEIQFLVKRVYCRLIEKILVKIAFYTMNSKHLGTISGNMLEIARNLETMIRRLHLIKDLRLLQQTILKVYKENLQIENKILELLVAQGYIVSIQEFYRINGIDVVHQDVFERKSPDQLKKKYELTIKEQVEEKKLKKQKVNVIQKDHIVKTNKEINEKYMACVNQIQKIIEEEKQDQIIQTPQKKRMSLNKTQPIPRMGGKKQSRFASTYAISKIVERDQSQKGEDSSSEHSDQLTRSNSRKEKPKLSYRAGLSSFSPEFTRLIKESENAKAIQRGSVLSEKIMEFNHFERGQRKRSKMNSDLEPIEFDKSIKHAKKKRSQQISTSAINKLIKMYETKHADRYSVQNFLSSAVGLPAELRDSLKEELLKLQNLYGPVQRRIPIKQQSLYISKTFSQSSYSQMSLKEADEEEDYQFIKNQTRSSIEEKKINYSSNKALKAPISSKDSSKIVYEKGSEHEEIDIDPTMDSVIEKNLIEEQISPVQNRQNSFIRLSRDRTSRIKTAQKIKSENLPVFTTLGVKNLQNSFPKNEEIPFKNEKLKRIPYIKNISKLTDSKFFKETRATENQTMNRTVCGKTFKAYSPSDDPKTVGSLKIYKKAYQNNILSKTVSIVNRKTVEQVVEDNSKITFKSLPKRIKDRKGNSLHKLMTVYQERRSSKELDQSTEAFKTFCPRWINRSVHQNRIEEEPLKLMQRDKKISTTVYQSCSEPVSPRNSENKENGFPYLYQIYDIRYRKKFQIPK